LGLGGEKEREEGRMCEESDGAFVHTEEREKRKKEGGRG
jgi:hypothetical protein